MNYYERHLGDYARDTAHLTIIEHGAYNLLLDRCYTTEQGIPDGQAHRLARARTPVEKAAVDSVLSEFFSLVDGHWVNRRVTEEIEKAHRRIGAAKENGKRGGRPRKERQGSENETQQKPNGLFVGSENETQQKAHQSPDTKHQTPYKEIPVVNPSVLVNSARPRSDGETPSGPPEWLEFFHAEHGIDIDHRSAHDRKKFWPLATAWATSGVTVGQMRQAIARAQADAKEPIAFLPAYADRVLSRINSPPSPPTQNRQQAIEARNRAVALEWLAQTAGDPK